MTEDEIEASAKLDGKSAAGPPKLKEKSADERKAFWIGSCLRGAARLSRTANGSKASAYSARSVSLAKRASALAKRAKAGANCDAGFMALSADT